jgi:hypothetical protein
MDFMARPERPYQVTLRMNAEEIRLRDELARRNGIDHAGVMRQALHRWAREEGISVATLDLNAANIPTPGRRK